MFKRILIVSILSLALLLTLAVSLGMAQQGTTGQTSEPTGKSQNESDGLVNPDDIVGNRIPVQGRLTDTSGNPINGSYDLTFNLYEVESGGIAVCSDTNMNVEITNGLFSTEIWGNCWGHITGQQLYLGIVVEGDGEMSPRQPIFATPYAWSLIPGGMISSTIGGGPILHIENSAANGRGLRAYATSQTGVNYGIVGASRSPDGFAGYFYNNGAGVALKAESANGVAITADGVINSTAPTYLWVSGNEVLPYDRNNTTIIDLNSHGGATIYRGDRTTPQSIVLPITIPGTLYGQDVRLTELNIYWQGDTSFDSIINIRLRRQTGACDSCWVEILYDPADHTCYDDENLQGCVISLPLTDNNILTQDSGILYLTLELAFESDLSWIDFGGARLTLAYDN
jgi:hypothetical protein